MRDEPVQPPTESLRPLVERALEHDSVRADGGDDSAPGEESETHPLVAALRHDVHKVLSQPHEHADAFFAGVRVNEPVPLGADRDAALLSRPDDTPEQTLANHGTWRRVSLLTGNPVGTTDDISTPGSAFRELIGIDDPAMLHAAWLGAGVPAGFNESPYYPYTSLKYHTLLTTALLRNYRQGYAFEDLYLAAGPGSEPDSDPRVDEALHRMVLETPPLTLRLTPTPADRPAASLGSPARSFADTWSRLSGRALDLDERRWRVLDAQLRRIRSWSAALQYVEDYVAASACDESSGTRGWSA